MELNNPVAVTAANCITAVGHDAVMTAASVRAGITRLIRSDDLLDVRGNPVTTAPIMGMDDRHPDRAQRLAKIARHCLQQLLADYFQDSGHRPAEIRLLLGAAAAGRPGPRYAEGCLRQLTKVIGEYTPQPVVDALRQGNAAFHHATAQAAGRIAANPQALCIVGGVDSLLGRSTVNWFEQHRRLKSESPDRSQTLIPGEGVGFLILEAPQQAQTRGKTVRARITALGLATEPAPFASDGPSTGQGLTEAWHKALEPAGASLVRTILCDLNGERSRARELHLAGARCFDDGDSRTLIHPAEYYGDIGAASGAVLAATAAQGLGRQWLASQVLITCSDDHGACGAMVMEH